MELVIKGPSIIGRLFGCLCFLPFFLSPSLCEKRQTKPRVYTFNSLHRERKFYGKEYCRNLQPENRNLHSTVIDYLFVSYMLFA